MKIIGVDPGISGAIALYGDLMDGLPPVLITTVQVPILKAKTRGNEVDWDLLAEMMQVNMSGADYAFVERVQTRPGESGSRAFKFGYAAGGIRGIIAVMGVPVKLVSPSTWKPAMGLTNDKAYSITKALEMMPEADVFRPERNVRTKRDCENLAEAALIARYGWEKMRDGG